MGPVPSSRADQYVRSASWEQLPHEVVRQPPFTRHQPKHGQSLRRRRIQRGSRSRCSTLGNLQHTADPCRQWGPAGSRFARRRWGRCKLPRLSAGGVSSSASWQSLYLIEGVNLGHRSGHQPFTSSQSARMPMRLGLYLYSGNSAASGAASCTGGSRIIRRRHGCLIYSLKREDRL